MEEVWRPVMDFIGYEVSNLGRVRSCRQQGKRREGAPETTDRYKVLRPRKQTQSGCRTIYCSIALRKDGKSISRSIHKMVLEAFVGLCPPGMEVRHRDGDGTNNRVDNLLWDTHQANIDDRRKHGTNPTGEKHPKAKLTEETAKEALLLLAAGWMHKDVAAKFGLSRPAITMLANGDTWKHLPRPETPT